jgi:membrane protein implicated in regulation of membrane protease activity
LQTVAPVFFPGFYTVTIAHRYDGKEDFSLEQLTLFLFPWQSVALLLVSGVVYGIRRRYSQRKLLKKDKKEENIA